MPVELPGHGSRFGEPACSHLPTLVEMVAHGLRTAFDRPYALFGHSMGALIAFELARHVRRVGLAPPRALLVSAFRAPQCLDPNPAESDLDDAAFIDKVRSLEGTPGGVLDDPELVNVLLPTLRADFLMCDQYIYVADRPLHHPLFAFGGQRDLLVKRDELAAWSAQTDGEFRMRVFNGGHFYWLSDSQPLLSAMSAELSLIAAGV